MNRHHRLLLIFILLLFTSTVKVKGQLASGMPFSFSVTPTVAASPAWTSIPVPGSFIDEWDTLLVPAAWSFVFAGVTYNKVVVSSNGWVALIPAASAAVNPLPYPANSLPNNLLSNNTTGFPIIAPLWDDLSTSLVRWNVTGNTLSINWFVKWQKGNLTANTGLIWIDLNGTLGLNTIGFHYINSAAYAPLTPSASIGIAGPCTGDFYSVSCQSALAATTDSSVENTNIGLGTPNNFRPNNVNFLFTPYHPYDNCSGSYPARNLGTINTTCTFQVASTFNATPSGIGNCATADDNDVWFQFIKPANISSVTVSTAPASCQSVTGTSMEIYTVCGGAPIVCATTSVTNPGYGEVTFTRPCSALPETLWVRVTADGDVPGKFQICAKEASGSGTTCASPRVICSIPYVQNGMTTTGSINNYDSLTAVCHTIAMNGEDFVFSYTPPSNQCIQVSITSTGVNPGLFVFSGCPDSSSGTATYCLGSNEAATGTVAINAVSLIAGQTYYIVVDNNGVGGIPFDINIQNIGAPPANDTCANATNLGTIANTAICATTIGTYTTSCSTPTVIGQAGAPTCIPGSIPSAFVNGVTGDVWLKFTAGFTGSLQINTFQSAVNATSNAAMAIYTGVCGAMGAPYACDNNSGPNGMPSLSIPIVNGNTYYIRVWSENPENAGNFDLCFQGNCAPANDFPCASVLVPLGGTASGFNTCASSVTEPVNAAQCVVGGTINTVWYKAVVPLSGSIRVRTHPLTLTDTQIQGYLFPVGCALSPGPGNSVSKGCNDDGTPCDGGFNDFSEQLFTGMLPGDTLFIAVDGVGSLTGSFEISIIDGATTVFPPVNLQDCAGAQVLCSTNSILVADPGFRNNGNICDLPAGTNGCWAVGERNSAWYQFTVDPALSGGTANIVFDILTPSSTDIDFLVWDVTGLSTACAQIQAKTLGNVGCNFAGALSATGLTTGALAAGYSPAITFSGAPRTYILLLNVYNSAANAGFTLNWNTTPISTSPTTAIWSGLTDTLYTTTTNWGDCGSTPSCAVDAIINNPSNGRHPTVLAGLPAKSVKNITINAGATLRIKAGATLSVCGNFTNFGTLICEPTSTIQFIGSGLQTISGILNTPNSFANLVINKPSGSVQLLTNIDVSENFTTVNATSIFNINGKYMKVAGNFTNFSGTTTFTGVGGSTVEFNGTGAQTFSNTNLPQILFNRVRMNKTGGRLYLTGVNSIMNIDTALTLNSGIIYTRNLATLEVNMKYYLPAAITGQNALSYIDGNLRRKISNPTGPSSPVIPASYDFPVGDSLTPGGYENANITFQSSTLVQDLLAYFTPWPAGPPAIGPAASECVSYTYDLLPAFDHGYWTFKRSTSTFGGNYDITLFNTGFGNNSGTFWTVAKANLLSPPSASASWRLKGSCFIASTAASTKRGNMNIPAADSTSFNSLYTTVQSNVQLPIELLYFNAEPDGEVVKCSWETASETNNEYFEVERSFDGNEFYSIGRVKGFGLGVSNNTINYSLIDPDLCDDIRYYRLKQIDFDGQFGYSETIALTCKSKSTIELFPNPANSDLTCRFTQAENNDLNVSVHDIAGRIIQAEKIFGKKGVNQIHLNIDELSAGAYFLRISNAENNIKLQSQFFKK